MGQNCWFCNQRPPVHGKSRPVKLKKLADGAGSSVHILRCSVSVPRCEECAAGHVRASSKAITLGFAGALVVFLVVVVWQPIEMPWWVMALLVVAGFLPGAMMLGTATGLPPGQKPELDAEAFMAVERLKRDGWMKDDQPWGCFVHSSASPMTALQPFESSVQLRGSPNNGLQCDAPRAARA